MAERPILFNGAMVRAILAGRKTQTRRVVKLQPRTQADVGHRGAGMPFIRNPDPLRPNHACPFGQPGDRLWVRETWMDLTGTGIGHWDAATGKPMRYAYGAESPPGSASDEARKDFGLKWRPSIHMPREACRLVLEITDLRIERLHAGDGEVPYESRYLAEGINRIHHGDGDYYYSAFRDEPHPKNWVDPFDAWRELWTSTGANWDSNPWVWVIEFKRIDSPQGVKDGR